VEKRNDHIDLLRAAAILMVIGFHLIQMSPVPLPRLMHLARAGAYGVDVFFVLSGWLIGGLYWKEQLRFGNVGLLRFWMRRWLRTIPPYLVALALSWIAVSIERREAFDWGYLIFIQNYYNRIPFFLVSWSLCIEEHFYLFLPLLLVFFAKTRWSICIFFVVMILTSMLARYYASLNGLSSDFGYEITATHFRLEGLILGFWLAYAANYFPRMWSKLRLFSPFLAVAAILPLVPLAFVSELWMYRVGLSVLAMSFCGILASFVTCKRELVPFAKIVRTIALTSYSVYLTHALVIHFSRRVVAFFPVLPWHAYFPIALGFIALTGAVFYFLIERSSIRFRDRVAPRRTFR
jgi:peptidoglycan/LPS O-acetylase OafA/YrhL